MAQCASLIAPYWLPRIALRSIRATILLKKFFRITYPRSQNLAYPARVLFGEGPLSRSDPSADRAKAGRTGAPRNGRWPDGWWSAGRRCALPWARPVHLAGRGGSIDPPPRGA